MSRSRRCVHIVSFIALAGAWASSPGARASPIAAEWTAAQITLTDHGVSLGGFFQSDGSHVLTGGLPGALGFDLQRLIDVWARVDTSRLLGWRGGTLFVDVQSHSGASVAARQVPAIADPDNMDAPAGTSVDRVWYQQDLLGKRLDLRAGLMYVDDQFFTVPYGGDFVSLDFSSDSSISTFVLPTYPKGAWGIDAFAHPNRRLSVGVGIFRDHSTELPYDPGGALIVTQSAWRSHWRGGLPMRVQISGWFDTGRFRRFAGGVIHHAAGIDLVASAQLWRNADAPTRGIGAFVQLGAAPAATAAVRQHIGAGVVWTGPFNARPRDEFGMALSDSLLSTAAGFRHRSERQIEMYYQFDATHGWTIQPDLQYWWHPGGFAAPDTLLGLVRVMLTF